MKAIAITKKVLVYLGLAFCAAELIARMTIPVTMTRQISEPHMFQNDKDLGYRLRANMKTRVRAWNGTRDLFRTVYQTDAYGRRIVPLSHPGTRDRHFIILGGSTSFGMGLHDDETLAWFLAEQNPRLFPYNYAGDGYGPQSGYYYAASSTLKNQVPQEEGTTVFFFQMINQIGGHTQTLLGRFELLLDGWGENLPLYKIKKGVPPESMGPMPEHAPFKYEAYKFLQLFHILNLLHPLVFPLTNDELQKTADFMGSMRDAVLHYQPKTKFLVVIHPLSDRHSTQNIVGKMRENGIEVLDLSNLIPEGEIESHIAFHRHFPHPNAKLNEKLARALNQYLYSEKN